MKLRQTTEITIDLERERQRIAQCRYTKQQRVALLLFVRQFERGNFGEAAALIDSWPREWREFLNATMFEVLYAMLAEPSPHIDLFDGTVTTKKWEVVSQ